MLRRSLLSGNVAHIEPGAPDGCLSLGCLLESVDEMISQS